MVRLVILAGGKAVRMGMDKLALPWKKTTVLGAVLECALESCLLINSKYGTPACELLITAQKPMKNYLSVPTIKALNHLDYRWLLSRSQPLSHNIRLGLTALPQGIKGVAFLPGDQIGVNVPELSSLLRNFINTKPDIQVPYHSDYGSPVIFSPKYLPDLRNLQGDRGGKHVLKNYPSAVTRYFVSESFLQDIDTPADYERLNNNIS